MNLSRAGERLIQKHEGLELKAYRCPAGVLTIGYGHTGGDVREGMTITHAQAEELLRQDLAWATAAVNDALSRPFKGRHGTFPVTQSQFDAMVSLTYNIGRTAFLRSSVFRRHRAGDYGGAAEAFLMWRKAGGRTLRGLLRRRIDEAGLYCEEWWP